MVKYILTTLAPVPRLTRVTDGHECIRFSKQLAVLAYLVSRPEARATRDELVGLLWSGASQQDGRRALRQVVYQIRRATDADLLRGEEALSLRREDIDADADLFRQLLAAGHFEVALNLYEQDYLSNVALAGAREFEQWAEGMRAVLAAERRQLLRTLIGRESDAGQWATAGHYAEMLIASDPASLEARLKLIELHALAGDVLRARAAAEQTRALAAETAGETPTQAVEDAIARAVAPSAAPEHRQADAFPRNPEMVGRATQFHTVVERWKSAQEGKGGAILISGEAGIGKTRLVREIGHRFNQDRSLVLETACYALEQSDPLGPFLELLRMAHSAPGLAGATSTSLEVLAALVPEIAGRFRAAIQPRTPPIQPQAVASALLEAFGAIADEAPLALIIEDLHWAPPGAVEFAHRLARDARTHPLLLVLTAREHASALETTRAVREFVSSGAVTGLPLGPLDEPDVENLLGGIAELPPEVAGCCLVEALVEHTDGIPLYLLEVLKELHDIGYLFVREGRWALGAKADARSAKLPIPSSGTDVLRSRLKKLGGRLPDVLLALAVWGREAPITTLAEISGLEATQVEEAIATLERRHLVGRREGLPVVAHDEIASAALDAAPIESVLRFHARAAAVSAELAARGRAPEWTIAAMHAAAAGDTEPATVWAAHAAREAERVSGPGAARAVLRRVIEAAPEPVRSQLRRSHGRVLDGSWSVRRWLEERDGTRRRKRIIAVAASLAVLIGGGWTLKLVLKSRTTPEPLGGGFIALSTDRGGLGRGTVTALRLDARFDAKSVPPDSLQPAIRRGFADWRIRPDQRVANVECSEPTWDATLVCALDLATGKSTVIARSESDAHLQSWLPDGSGFVMTAERVVGGRAYAAALVLADTAGRTIRSLADDGSLWQGGLVSPRSDRLLAHRADSAQGMLLLTLEGRMLGSLDWCQAHAAWSPDGQRVACQGSTGNTIVYGEARPGSTPSAAAFPVAPLRAVWSPDGNYIAATADVAGSELYVIDTRIGGEPRLVWRSTRSVTILGWAPSRATPMAQRIAVDRDTIALAVGGRASIAVRALDAGGAEVPLPRYLRWVSSDSSVARVSGDGQVVADRPGVGRVIVALGLHDADTETVLVRATESRLLFTEDFERGLDTIRWKPFGYPLPRVLPGLGLGGSAGFNNNGDQHYTSGIVSRIMLDLRRGLTVEYWARVPFRNPLWEETGLELTAQPADSFRTTRGTPDPGGASLLWAYGPQTDPASKSLDLGFSGYATEAAALPLRLADGDWHRYRLVVYPFGQARWFADGIELLPPVNFDPSKLPRATLWVGGRSVNTFVMVDAIKVWEGVVLDPVQPARAPSRKASTGRTEP